MAEQKAAGAGKKELVIEKETLLGQILEATPERARDGLDLALDAFVGGLSEEDVIDRTAADRVIARIEAKMEAQINEILHQEEFQRLEGAWKGLDQMVQRTDFLAEDRVIIEIINVSKDELRGDFQLNPADMIRTGLYDKVYTQAYDPPGGPALWHHDRKLRVREHCRGHPVAGRYRQRGPGVPLPLHRFRLGQVLRFRKP